jgi:hypothetical protein
MGEGALTLIPSFSFSTKAKRKEMFVRQILLVFVLFILGLPAGGEGQTAFSLRIRDFEGANLLILPIHIGDQFYIHYIHSSDKTPVLDTFQIDDTGQLVLVEEAFLWYGAGLEFQSHPGTQVVFDGKWSRVRLNRVLPELPIRVGRIAEQRLTLGNQSIRFDRLVKAGETLVLRVKTEGNRR